MADDREPALEAAGLVKAYGEVMALGGIDVRLAAGSVHGVLGPNGAGKTTLVESAVGLRAPTRGTIRVLGQDPRAAGRRLFERVALQPQSAALFPELTVAETLALWRSLYPDPLSTEAVLETVDLADRRDVRAGTLSGGQSQRLLLGMTLLPDPDLLILDEPSAGLDPTARRALWNTIRGQREAGRTVVLTTHDMDEVDQLCDRVVIIDRGIVVDSGTPEELTERHFPLRTVEFVVPNGTSVGFLGDVASVNDVETHRVDDGHTRVRCRTDAPDTALRELLVRHELSDARDVRVREASMDDVFVRLTGSTIDDEGRRIEQADVPGEPPEAHRVP